MKKIYVIVAVAVLVGGFCWAEELYSPFKVGISASFPEIPTGANVDQADIPGLSLGCIIHLSPQIAIRPAANFYRNTWPSSDGLAYGGGADFLYFFNVGGNASLYLGAGYSYTGMTVTTGTGAKDESDYQYHRIALIIGGQYLLSKNFGFFVEMGLDAFFKVLRQQSWDVSRTLIADNSYNGSYQLLHSPTLGAVIYFN